MSVVDAPTPELVASIRTRARLTQEELAQRLGVSFSTVNAWETGRSSPQPRHRRRLEDLAAELDGAPSALRALVVDDDETELAVLSELIRDAGEVLEVPLTVTTESDGMRALIVLGRLQPDVAFVDVIMPGLDGLALADRVDELDGFSRSQLVLVTAGRDQAIAAGAEQRGLTLIDKPLTIRTVGRVLREAAARRADRHG
ncbi:MAG: response regulator [Nitriliruptoraceae bacterium]